VPEAREVLLALVRQADVFLTNFAPERLARLRLTWDDLGPANPRLVYASLTGYGEVGPEANKPGYDITAWWARSGLMDLVRPVDEPPSPSMPGMGDHPTALAVLAAIMLGLYRRERTGRGTRVSTSLLANGAWSNSILLQALLCGATFLERRPRHQARNALSNLYRARDGRWFLLTLLNEESDWPRLPPAIGRPDLRDDPRFATTAARRANAPALVAVLDEVFAGRDWPEWRARLDAHGVPCGGVSRLEDLRDDPQLEATGTVVPLPLLGHPGLRTVMNPLQIHGEEPVPPGPAPALGEHTEEVLRSLGYDDAALGRLRRHGAIP
jgi:crotonobetainyl-CoA:carnitine CoA-transferase CaiB-like acyl-CoA transferase